jgi:transcriptional regulator with XRE-family HTH domain
MKIPAVQPISATQSRASRFQLGLTQADVIEQSGLPGYKLKQFETGRFVPDMPFLQKLAEFFSGKGIELDEVKEPSDGNQPAPTPVPTPKKPGSDMVRHVQRPCFYVSDSVTPVLLDQCLERMHDNDERIAVILKKSLKTGLLGDGYSEETAKEHQELFGAMAEGYLIFRLLQGNPIVQPNEGKTDAKTHADLLGQFYAKSPIVALQETVEEGEQ